MESLRASTKRNVVDGGRSWRVAAQSWATASVTLTGMSGFRTQKKIKLKKKMKQRFCGFINTFLLIFCFKIRSPNEPNGKRCRGWCLSFGCKLEIDRIMFWNRYRYFHFFRHIWPVTDIRLATDTDISKLAYRYICRYLNKEFWL